MSIRVGIVGISGFGGGEAMRLVASHPSFELVYAAGEGSAGNRLVDRFPGVPTKLAELVIEKWDPASLPKLDVLFASLPTGASAEALARVTKDVKIVDIGGDHRYVEGWAYGLADVWPAEIEGHDRCFLNLSRFKTRNRPLQWSLSYQPREFNSSRMLPWCGPPLHHVLVVVKLRSSSASCITAGPSLSQVYKIFIVRFPFWA